MRSASRAMPTCEMRLEPGAVLKNNRSPACTASTATAWPTIACSREVRGSG